MCSSLLIWTWSVSATKSCRRRNCIGRSRTTRSYIMADVYGIMSTNPINRNLGSGPIWMILTSYHQGKRCKSNVRTRPLKKFRMWLNGRGEIKNHPIGSSVHWAISNVKQPSRPNACCRLPARGFKLSSKWPCPYANCNRIPASRFEKQINLLAPDNGLDRPRLCAKGSTLMMISPMCSSCFLVCGSSSVFLLLLICCSCLHPFFQIVSLSLHWQSGYCRPFVCLIFLWQKTYFLNHYRRLPAKPEPDLAWNQYHRW